MAWLDVLRGIMPPGPGAGDVVDWDVIESSWGTRFPSDYKEFVSVYGQGSVGDYLALLLPERNLGDESPVEGMSAETRNARHACKAAPSHELQPSSLVAWGVDASADIICWSMAGGDPDGWFMAVWNQDDARWREYSCGMVEFLCRVFRADFDECPLGSLSLWGNESPKFVHRDEERRLRVAGMDPWSGGPDPFAGMFGE
ncbi:SMI1/KNR4 family protein [Streptomyces sp. yr375]|uniref:SMI1/KNR4 family protein n=1 Tax=Streptomyces sp. yr375 TaxID=1761906 RepID=UPI000B82A4E5|nr:SMI1/KNR4 family protein [Streptomyces sp. yr375]